MSDSPPDSWYDPPEPRHTDGSIIKDECNCEECHGYHVEENLWDELATNHPKDFQCCVDEMAIRIDDGRYCIKHKTDTEYEKCEECKNGN